MTSRPLEEPSKDPLKGSHIPILLNFRSSPSHLQQPILQMTGYYFRYLEFSRRLRKSMNVLQYNTVLYYSKSRNVLFKCLKILRFRFADVSIFIHADFVIESRSSFLVDFFNGKA